MILYLVGTKAQYIKMAPVVLATQRRALPFKLVLTGQHRETFDDLERNFALPRPHAVLVEGAEASDRSSLLRWLMNALSAAASPPFVRLWRAASVIVVHGDTASTLLGAHIGRRHGRPVAHVEAGLRSFNYLHPFPEELIRVLVSRMASLHFCPSEEASRNLVARKGECVVTSGNTLKDSLRLALAAQTDAPAVEQPYAVFSMHRHENLFNRRRLGTLLEILRGLTAVLAVKFVLHPVTRQRLERAGLIEGLRAQPNLELVPRMDFFKFVRLIGNAAFVATDGGSNQEECAMLKIPCILLRQATERPDGLNHGTLLGDTDGGRILEFARQHLSTHRLLMLDDTCSPSAEIVARLAQLAANAQVAGAA